MSAHTRQMENPTGVVHRFMQDHQRVCVWLVHDPQMRLEGNLLGYDEFMNVVLGDTTETNLRNNKSYRLGKILLRSDNVGVIYPIGA
ncbi:SmE / small nuclear ribonucleoprotein Sm-E [Leishmania donovani]|uniref:Small nuclear ribonucleoprotein E n=1 Tax=Leishmania donovani TaxID=5661 RepID=A0A3Q8IEV2_LEIDO|nr:small nuclear ribonucleoprotein polypeptide e, putative [Leishmania donovani]AYU80924.1 small nuclear ribonucleoprotein polypeptide e, putative [Leishmania donovani]CAJ1990910.1 SmE / small nuclear ribonucleoprotein Sm-E [Leishmania donovani]CBZ36148.1 small nuclear ribonucleoprotein polypeptide e, putative [Leishmania donovani]VDZ46761.1 small_nuclear_ribonucleoprotein_CDS_e_putative/GeneDB:LmjF.30.1205 [Leishmania donovani]